MKKAHDIRLLGQKITIKTDVEDPDLVDEVVALVNRKLRYVESRAKIQSPQQVAILALLELAEDYLQAKRKTIDFKHQVGAKTQRLRGLLGLVEADHSPSVPASKT